MQNETESDVHLHRVDAAQNMRRFYAARLQPTLFGDVSVMRAWGRIGTAGRSMIETFEDEQAARLAFGKLIRAKRQRGYVPPIPARASSPGAI